MSTLYPTYAMVNLAVSSCLYNTEKQLFYVDYEVSFWTLLRIVLYLHQIPLAIRKNITDFISAGKGTITTNNIKLLSFKH